MRRKCHPFLTTTLLATLLTGGAVRAEEAALPPVTAVQPPVKLSLAHALELALSQGPVSREAAARGAAADAALSSSHALNNPSLSVAHGAGRNTGGLDEDILVTQTIELGGKRGARISQARSERDAAYADKAGTAADASFAVKSAYYEALRTDDDYQLAMNALEVAQRFAGAARTQYAAGDVPQSNVLRAEVEQSRAETDLASAETERRNQFATLRSLAGLPEASSIELTDRLTFSPVALRLPDLQALAATNRPDLRAARSLVESLRAALRLASAQSRPDLFVEGRRGSVDPSEPGSSVRAGITLPLWDLGRNRAEVTAARATLAEQQAKLEEATRTARLEVETALNTLTTAQKLVESFQGGRLERAKQLLDMAETGYTKGANSYLEVLDAQRVYANEQASYTHALASYNTALATLEHAVGGQLK